MREDLTDQELVQEICDRSKSLVIFRAVNHDDKNNRVEIGTTVYGEDGDVAQLLHEGMKRLQLTEGKIIADFVGMT